MEKSRQRCVEGAVEYDEKGIEERLRREVGVKCKKQLAGEQQALVK